MPLIETVQLIMPNQATPPIPNPTILNRLSDHFDLVMALAEVMSTTKAYASLAALSLANQEYHGMLQPFIKRAKRRIVVKLSKLEELPQSRYKDIEIVECGPESVVRSEDDSTAKARGLSRYDAGFKPWLLTFRGTPPHYLPDLQERLLPWVDMIRVVERDNFKTLQESSSYGGGCDCCEYGDCEVHWEPAIFERYIDKFFTAPASSRGLKHFRYQVLNSPSLAEEEDCDQVYYTMKMISTAGNTWESSRHEGHAVASIDHLLHEPMLDWGTFGFDNLLFGHIEDHINQIVFNTYFHVRPKASVHHTLQDRQAFSEFIEELEDMAKLISTWTIKKHESLSICLPYTTVNNGDHATK